MAIRDRDIAAEIIGVRPLRTKMLAFGISSFYCGVAGAELVFLFLGSAETLAFDINQSFLVLFMIIIGGLGSILDRSSGPRSSSSCPSCSRTSRTGWVSGCRRRCRKRSS